MLSPGNVTGYGLDNVCSGVSVYGLGLYSSMGTRLWDVAKHRAFLWLWVKCRFPGDDALLGRAVVLSSTLVLFVLGLTGVTSWGQGLVNYGARDI